MPKIKFKLAVWENIVLFKILEQDERFLNQKFQNEGYTYFARNNVRICSRTYPEILEVSPQSIIVYLRGFDKSLDTSVRILKCSNSERAIEVKSLVLAALKDWAENCPEFKEDKLKKYTDVLMDTYEF